MGNRLPNVMAKDEDARVTSYTYRAKCPRTHHEEKDPSDSEPSQARTVFVRNGYRAEVCPGGAHAPDSCADNCMLCAPMWGVIARPVKMASVVLDTETRGL